MSNQKHRSALTVDSQNCYCSACGLHFSGVAGFDVHLLGPSSDRRCKTELLLRSEDFEPNSRGFCRIPMNAGELSGVVA